MEYINAVNIIAAVIVLLMFYFLIKLLTSDIGENRFFYIMAFVVLGVGLYTGLKNIAIKGVKSTLDPCLIQMSTLQRFF